MADSEKEGSDYAASESPRATARASFRARLLPTLAALVVLPIFISLGNWQWNKASVKEAKQTLLDARSAAPALELPSTLVDPEEVRYHRVSVRGEYETARQILIDNRIHEERAGYHVITPLRIKGSDVRVLVNRGWVPALADHSQNPVFETPVGEVDVDGIAIVPGNRFFTLAPEPVTSGWQVVWQNLDLARYRKIAGVPVQPVVIELDPQSKAGGFARAWVRPDDRREKHVSYALQWWGFAVATIAIWLFTNFRRQK